MADNANQFTQLLHDWSGGDQAALDQLVPIVNGELRKLAASFMNRERPGHTLQPTALVNEAYMRLVQQDQPEWQSKAHFMAVAAQYMRQILVDHARKRRAEKRGGGEQAVTLDNVNAFLTGRPVELLDLDEALTELSAFDARKGRVVEMHFFGGMSQEEVAVSLGVHVNTVARELRLSRAWLKTRLAEPEKKI